MNIRLYFPNSIAENSTGLLSKEHAHYVINVMRLKRGSKINLFNKNGEWESEIIFLERERVEVKFLSKIKESSRTKKIVLAICLVKKNPMETILQKATELGIGKIIPIVSERTEVKDLNYERSKKIIVEATEQSNQLEPPEISKVFKLKEFLKNLDKEEKLIFSDVNTNDKISTLKIQKNESLIILVGPEGDFTPTERKMILTRKNTFSITLSENILRTDTAVISAISLIKFILSEH